jgi:hypothetical protein
MRLYAIAAIVLAVFLAVACHKPSAVSAAPTEAGLFAVILERSATGWPAHCEAGCQWTAAVTVSCDGCDLQLDASRIARVYPSPAPKGFAFVVSNARGGWTASRIQGVRWQKLCWNCGAALCRGRLDETGVGSA